MMYKNECAGDLPGVSDEVLQQCKTRVAAYMQSFSDELGQLHSFLQLKADHTARVAAFCRKIAVGLGWDTSASNLAELLGWYHDVGRFPQFAEYGNFSDAVTFNHGERGADELHARSLLVDIDSALHSLVVESVRHHNARMIPDELPCAILPWLRLIRDADKLDIYDVVLAAYRKDGFQDLSEMLPHIDRTSRVCSERVLDFFERRECCSMAAARTIGDFFLLQVSWIYDINYPSTIQHLLDFRILDQVLALVEPPDRVARAKACMQEYLAEREQVCSEQVI